MTARAPEKQTLWRAIAAELRAEIAAGCYASGAKLPTEAALAARFGVNRHTVRQALADLVEAGLVRTRRGAGAFVAFRPADYPIGPKARFHQNLRAAGRMPDRRILSVETRLAAPEEAAALGLPPGAAVHACEGVSLADGAPMALFRTVFPADALPGLPAALRAERSITRALARCGVDDYSRVSTRLTAQAATPTQALHLHLRPGDPVLQSVGVNVDGAGRPVEFGVAWFAGERVTLTVGREVGGPGPEPSS
jgi:GntR family phosphonate transport system transcriptional regulator